jgi:hypothetical protein
VQFTGQKVFKRLTGFDFPGGFRRGGVLPLVGQAQFQGNFAGSGVARLAGIGVHRQFARPGAARKGPAIGGTEIPHFQRGAIPPPAPDFLKAAWAVTAFFFSALLSRAGLFRPFRALMGKGKSGGRSGNFGASGRIFGVSAQALRGRIFPGRGGFIRETGGFGHFRDFNFAFAEKALKGDGSPVFVRKDGFLPVKGGGFGGAAQKQFNAQEDILIFFG